MVFWTRPLAARAAILVAAVLAASFPSAASAYVTDAEGGHTRPVLSQPAGPEPATRGAADAGPGKVGAAPSGPDLALPTAADYGDCSGRQPIPSGIYRYTCHPGIYLIAHSWSLGSGFLPLRPGATVAYAGRLFTVYEAYSTTTAAEWGQAHYSPAPLTLHTCLRPEGGEPFLVVHAR